MNTQNMFRKATVAALALGILTPSCIQIPSLSGESGTVAQGTALGATGGAAVGALAGMAIGGNADSAKKGAAIGGIIGAIAGYAWSKSSVKKKQAYANNQQYVQANNTQLANRIAQTQQYNQQLTQQATLLRQQGQQLSQQQVSQLSNGISLINQDLANAQEARKVATGAQLTELNQNIANLTQQKSVMESLISSLAQ